LTVAKYVILDWTNCTTVAIFGNRRAGKLGLVAFDVALLSWRRLVRLLGHCAVAALDGSEAALRGSMAALRGSAAAYRGSVAGMAALLLVLQPFRLWYWW